MTAHRYEARARQCADEAEEYARLAADAKGLERDRHIACIEHLARLATICVDLAALCSPGSVEVRMAHSWAKRARWTAEQYLVVNDG